MIKKLLPIAASLFVSQAHAGVINIPPDWATESAICTVVLRAPIDASKPLQPSNPMDAMASLPAVCTGNIMQQMTIAGGVRQMMTMNFRVTTVSHQVTPIKSDPDGKTELLITAFYGMERITFHSK